MSVGKILNPKTGKYVNKDGKIGRELLVRSRRPKSKTVRSRRPKSKTVRSRRPNYVFKSRSKRISRSMKYKKNIINVLGPRSYEYYIILGKKIHVFGETHMYPHKCNKYKEYIHIDVFLDKIFRNNPNKKYDLFVELYYRKDDYSTILSGVDLGYNSIFTNCLQVNKKNCPYKNLRGHYVDIRAMSKDIRDKHSYILESIYLTLNMYEYLDKNEQKDINYDQYKKIYEKYFENITRDNFLEFKNIFIEILNGTYKINKQYENIDPSLSFKLFEFFNNKMNSYFENCELNKYNKDICIEMYHNVFTLIMDKYAIGRLFRNFKSIEMKNIILYVGDLHRKHYTELFNYLGYNPIYSDKNDNFKVFNTEHNCVSVDLNNF